MASTCKCVCSESREIPYSGDQNAEIVLVGESPKMEELKKRQLFVGEPGDLLSSLMEQSGMNIRKMFLASAIRCPVDKDTLTAKQLKEIMACCRPNLASALHEIKPKLIVCFGVVAMEQVLGIKGMKDKRGSFIHSSEFGCDVFVTWHP